MYIGAHGTLVVGVLQITQRLIITICYVITQDTLSALAYSSQPQWVGVHWGLTAMNWCPNKVKSKVIC